MAKQQNTCDLAGWLHKPDCTCQYRTGAPISSKERSPRPQKTSASSHYNWLMDLARWCGIHWEISSMHVTAENAIMVAADKQDEIERLRAALHTIAYLKQSTGYAVDAQAVARLALSGDSPAVETSEEAWLFECSRPGHRMAFASIDKDDSTWWPRDQWKLVTRMPLISLGQREVLWGNPPAQETSAVRAGVSVKDPTPPQEITLCAAMGPSGFICERPKGHAGRHRDGDNTPWPAEKASAQRCLANTGEIVCVLVDGHPGPHQFRQQHTQNGKGES